ncbi:ATP synthase F0 subcomplex B subunit [Pseudonocardia sediminis]|uniref:ATP synthase subunit b n=1 Tax=Pseudonocardia sediminis TaxID=1397368 RepID=A0A4Q7UX53_PSEST|nr:F0F1 ATP synthase subunit B [Pseudonocardia sediminis]RZT85608.1 ATP synthase F0 subcomplex B subunit [Pseudonocardia sediminis]
MQPILAAETPLPVLPYASELILGITAFAILVFVLWKYGLPRFERTYKDRTDGIKGGLKRADDAQQEADRLKKKYEEQMAGLRAEGARIRDDARAEAQQIKTELREEGEHEVARIRARAEEQIAAYREQAERNLRGEVGGMSVELAERLLADSLADGSRRSATVDSFLGELGAMSSQRTGTNG